MDRGGAASTCHLRPSIFAHIAREARFGHRTSLDILTAMKLRLDRAFAVPAARVLSSEDGVTRVQIEGLICDDVCAARSKQALERIDGVEHVELDFRTGVVTIEGRAAPEAAYQRAIDSVAAAKPLRRALAALKYLRPTADQAP